MSKKAFLLILLVLTSSNNLFADYYTDKADRALLYQLARNEERFLNSNIIKKNRILYIEMMKNYLIDLTSKKNDGISTQKLFSKLAKGTFWELLAIGSWYALKKIKKLISQLGTDTEPDFPIYKSLEINTKTYIGFFGIYSLYLGIKEIISVLRYKQKLGYKIDKASSILSLLNSKRLTALTAASPTIFAS